jgi:hypothetical protein
MEDDAFNEAASLLCVGIPSIFRNESRLVRAMGDAGAFVVVVSALGIAKEGNGRSTLAAVQAVVVPRAWAADGYALLSIGWNGLAPRPAIPPAVTVVSDRGPSVDGYRQQSQGLHARLWLPLRDGEERLHPISYWKTSHML